jgi:ring-1,2-phenylacetyl-CoA epoxidase subunit PaaC
VSAPAATMERIDAASALPDDARAALRDLILVLADSKRVLGLRYSDRMLGAPTLEAGIAASSMAQDEWGHARLTYAMLGDFGDDPKALEHARPAAEYRSHPALDRVFGSWSEMLAAALVVDTALAVQYAALLESRYAPAQTRIQKMLDEERFHFRYAAGWVRKVAQVPELRGEMVRALREALAESLRWFGPGDGGAAGLLADQGLVREGADALRARLLKRIGPALAEAGLAEELGLAGGAEGWSHRDMPTWEGWNETTRRSGGALDEETAARARGDRNRALLLD